MISYKLFGDHLEDIPDIMDIFGQTSNHGSTMTSIRQGLFRSQMQSNTVDIECDKAFFVTKDMKDEPIIRLLVDKRKFDIHDEINWVDLPVEPRQAFFFKMSPFSEPSMPSYVDSFHEGVKQFIDRLNSTQDIKRAVRGDEDALKRLLSDLTSFLAAVKQATKTAKLYIGLPYQPRTEELPVLFASGYWSTADVLKELGRN